jgi:predicted nucleic acid-binding protein
VTACLLDTTVLIDALRGRPATERIRRLRAGGEEVPHICAINVEEVVRGLRTGEEVAVRRFLDGLRLAPIGRAQAERAGQWRRAFGERGVTLSQADCLIAAAADGVGATLITGNPKDFPMEEVAVEHWPVGE